MTAQEDAKAYPNIDLFVDGVSSFHIKQFRGTIRHCTVFCSNILLRNVKVVRFKLGRDNTPAAVKLET